MFRAVGRRWLGLSPLGIEALPLCGACGQPFADKSAQARTAHLAACNAAARPSRARGAAKLPTYHGPSRAVELVLRDCCEEAGFYAETQTEDLIEGTEERPADVMVYLGTQAVAVDVVITHLNTASSQTSAARHPGQPVEAAAGVKRTRYADRLVAGLSFVPFSVDDFGHLGDAAVAFLDQLAVHAAARRTEDYRQGRSVAARRTYWLARWQERLAWAVHAGIDDSLQRRLDHSRRLSRRDVG